MKGVKLNDTEWDLVSNTFVPQVNPQSNEFNWMVNGCTGMSKVSDPSAGDLQPTR